MHADGRPEDEGGGEGGERKMKVELQEVEDRPLATITGTRVGFMPLLQFTPWLSAVASRQPLDWFYGVVWP
ncbi:hypothetical protein E2C01_079653 [Portunus trituberculatus]|uniref:Uncharacterized protein n=1 Tax=Portunus trituberculatus TaxID=210409 RepID=A0A5B7IM25_PORTR|nr:hypothetical protein [Portunus trituberculatus]